MKTTRRRRPTYTKRVATAERKLAPSLIDDAIHVFEVAMGGRELLVSALATAPELSPEAALVLNDLADPRLISTPLHRLCANRGLTVGDLLRTFKQAEVAAQTIRAIHLTAAKLPEIVSDLIAKAYTHQEPCGVCRATGTVLQTKRRETKVNEATVIDFPEEAVVCPECAGYKVLRIKGDLDTQQVLLQLIGLLQKGGGLTIQQNTQHNTLNAPSVGAGASGPLAQLQQACADLVWQRRPLLEGELAAEPADPT